MLFNSLIFILVFLPATYAVFWALRTRNQRFGWLAFTGYVFYAFWDIRFCGLMAFSTLVSFGAGLGFLRFPSGIPRRLCLVVPVTVDLLLLGFFKYGDFAVDTANGIAGWLGRPLGWPRLDVILPVGISFYTFHTITYIVDCHRRVVEPTRNPLEFAAYVSLFSQLVAGPIVRFREIEKDLERIDTTSRRAGLDPGLSLFCLGLAKKVLLADTLAAVVDPALRSVETLGTLEAWACALGYAYQLYFDFSGYSDMAMGLGRLFGLHIPRNFDSPYKALDIADFWRRWHISLSSCLRDYLYIPLGGSRGGAAATARNLMITMLLGGLWHGAGWTFVAWGAYHGALLVLHRIVARAWNPLPAALRRAATFLLVVIGWVIFRSDGFPMATAWLRAMFSFDGGSGMPGLGVLAVLVPVLGWLCWAAPNTLEVRHAWRPLARAGIVAAYVLSLGLIYGGRASPFLYFQF